MPSRSAKLLAMGVLGGTSYHALARTMLANAASSPYGGNMPSPPTVTVGAQDANSTVATSRTNIAPGTLLTSANLTQVSGNGIAGTSPNFNARYITPGTSSTVNGRSRGWGVRCIVPPGATMFDVATRNVTSDGGWRVRINGLWVQTDDFTAGPVLDGAHYYYTKFDPVSPGDIVEVYFGAGANVPGLNFGNGGSAAFQPLPSDPVQTKVVTFIDSYIYGTGPASCRGSWSHKFAEQMGIPNLVNSGVGGTGLIATSGGTAKKALDRISDITQVYAPDLVLVAGSLNDNGTGTATLQAACTAFFQALGALVPRALIGCFGIEHSPGNNPSAAYDAAMAAGFAAAGLGVRGKFFPTPDGMYQDTADSSLYVGDNVHPSDAGSVRYATYAVNDFKAWLRTL